MFTCTGAMNFAAKTVYSEDKFQGKALRTIVVENNNDVTLWGTIVGAKT